MRVINQIKTDCQAGQLRVHSKSQGFRDATAYYLLSKPQINARPSTQSSHCSETFFGPIALGQFYTSQLAHSVGFHHHFR